MNIAILGSGAWGCTLAHHLSKSGSHQIILWEKDPSRCEVLCQKRQPYGISEYVLGQEIEITDSLESAVAKSSILLVVIPSQFVNSLLTDIRAIISNDKAKHQELGFLLASKGIDLKHHVVLSSFFDQKFPECPMAVLSGPCIAREIAGGIPTSVVISSKDKSWAEFLIENFSSETLRCYFQPDVVGVELGGALKNCIAIAAGISDGLGFGENTKSALLSRGLAEIARLSKVLGADEQTLFGLSGLGDLAVTCFSKHSRNRTFGQLLGEGKSAQQAREEIRMTVEGEKTAFAALELAGEHKIEVPIIEAVVRVCEGKWSPADAVGNLMNRDTKPEFYGSDQ